MNDDLVRIGGSFETKRDGTESHHFGQSILIRHRARIIPQRDERFSFAFCCSEKYRPIHRGLFLFNGVLAREKEPPISL